MFDTTRLVMLGLLWVILIGSSYGTSLDCGEQYLISYQSDNLFPHDRCECSQPFRVQVNCNGIGDNDGNWLYFPRVRPGVHTLQITGATTWTYIPPDAFNIANHLVRLVLRDDKLSEQYSYFEFPVELFRPIGDTLQHLDMSHNRFSLVPKAVAYGRLTRLRFLDLSYNRIFSLSNSIFNELTSLLTLNLQYNPINFIHANAFRGINSLQSLSISINISFKLSSFPVSNLKELRSLSIYDSKNIQYKSFDSELIWQEMSQLEHLTLYDCNIRSSTLLDLAIHFSKLSDRLLSLNMAHNKLQMNDPDGDLAVIARLSNLQVLDLSYNRISEFAPGFTSIIQQLQDLYKLNLRGNRINELDIMFTSIMHKVPHIDLRDNNLTTSWLRLAGEDATVASSLLLLSGNPWNCDCNLQWLYTLIMSTINNTPIQGSRFHLDVADAYNLTCQSPDQWRGQNVWRVPETVFKSTSC